MQIVCIIKSYKINADVEKIISKVLRYANFAMVKKMLIIIFFFKIKEGKITRGHNFTLVKKQNRLDVRKFSFSQRTINVWNTLATECVHASKTIGDGDCSLVRRFCSPKVRKSEIKGSSFRRFCSPKVRKSDDDFYSILL